MGAVMGSKKLKAVIVKASGTVPVAEPEKFQALAKRYLEIWSGASTASHKEYGSLILIAQQSAHTRIHNQQTKMTPEQH